MPPTFPDHSNQEQPIRTIGNAELLYKRGEKILRWQKARWGGEAESFKYNYLAPYLTGRVLHLGVGMGLSLEAILASRAVTEVIAYEVVKDIADLYGAEHTADPRLKIEAKDAHDNKPTGTFDTCLYELPVNSQVEYDKTKTYLQWIWARMNTDGYLILPVDRFSIGLMAEFPQLNWFEIAVKDSARPSLKPFPIWIVVRKK